jgi:hypothetical protein
MARANIAFRKFKPTIKNPLFLSGATARLSTARPARMRGGFQGDGGTQRTNHCLFTAMRKSPSRRTNVRSNEKIVIVRGALRHNVCHGSRDHRTSAQVAASLSSGFGSAAVVRVGRMNRNTAPLLTLDDTESLPA